MGQTQLEQEKGFLEKLESNLKTNFYNVVYLLLKDNETTQIRHILFILLDYIQIYYFTFSPTVKYQF